MNSDQVFQDLGFQVFKATARDRLWVSVDLAPLTHAYTRAEIRERGWVRHAAAVRIVLRRVSSYGGSNQWLDHKLCWFVVSPTVTRHGFPRFVVVYDAMTGKELANAESS